MPTLNANCDQGRVANRPIVALTLSAFVAIAAVRMTDPLLPKLAREFATTPTGASIVSTSAMLAYGVCQVGYGPLGERHGKYTVVTAVTLLGAALAKVRYLALMQLGPVQRVLVLVGAEGFLLYGAQTFVGAFLKNDLGMSYSGLGLVLACFGISGLAYTVLAPYIVRRLGERGMMFFGGLLMCAGFSICSLATVAWSVSAAMASSGFGFYLMHNTLQTRASQMAPSERGLGMSMFSS